MESQRARIPPFHVMEVFKKAHARDRLEGDVLHLEVGQPSTPAPAPVRDAASRALIAERLGYTNALGVDALRDRIAMHYLDRHGLGVHPSRVAVTVGASGGMVLALLAAFDAGARIGITAPGYAAYRNIVRALDLDLIDVRVDESTRYVPTSGVLDRVDGLDGLIVASPSNPTGTQLTGDELADLAVWCRRNGVTLLMDEIYHGISYVGPAPTVLGYHPEAIVLQSFSKYYSMTGWRIGWLVLPKELVPATERLAQNLFICPPALAQHAAVVAFDATVELDGNVARYAESRTLLGDALDRWGLPYAPPDGAFYFWVDVSGLGDSRELADRWLDEAGVAVTPGIDFDPTEGHRFVRLSYSESLEDIAAAIERLDPLIR
ncbi:MAG: aminotransferase class I/II-fold pyridoxal phosphate-dependent enzyme [Acidimicrobiia bacterium]